MCEELMKGILKDILIEKVNKKHQLQRPRRNDIVEMDMRLVDGSTTLDSGQRNTETY